MFSDGELIVTPVGLDKSNAVTSLAEQMYSSFYPGGREDFKGDQVDVLLVEDQRSKCRGNNPSSSRVSK